MLQRQHSFRPAETWHCYSAPPLSNKDNHPSHAIVIGAPPRPAPTTAPVPSFGRRSRLGGWSIIDDGSGLGRRQSLFSGYFSRLFFSVLYCSEHGGSAVYQMLSHPCRSATQTAVLRQHNAKRCYKLQPTVPEGQPNSLSTFQTHTLSNCLLDLEGKHSQQQNRSWWSRNTR